ncbi:uncharacterized protein LOC132755673 [Ruditapes philippinarum]|uniref:uncharacterized protein LOC132755673 n=1 Tax=Ruditapes philippinarum TaxID=129788 RepID=UPI00295AE6CA|nr:uncharacterized protein LOC132755673 [Ruditapes philippinarum]
MSDSVYSIHRLKECHFSNEDLCNLTGLNKDQFLDLSSITEEHVRNTPVRSHITTLGIFMFKLKSGLSNKILSTLFDVSKSSIRRAVHTIRKVLVSELVPKYLGFQHISREEIIKSHTRSLSQSLLAENASQAIIVLDGTYIYIRKSTNFKFQRRSYSVHKGRPLVKPMVIVSTTGYFISVLGPYLVDSKNSDSGILNHAVRNNIEEIKNWAQPNDIFVVDRGFRDSLQVLEEMGIKAQMPKFMPKGAKQLTTMDANHSRLVTKVRWEVEASNARIKRWKYLDHVLPTNQVPYIGDYVRIICATCNKYLSPLNATKDLMDDTLVAERMRDKIQNVNHLQSYVQENELYKRNISKWQAVQEIDNFPSIDDFTLSLLTLGTYQMKLCQSYAQEYLDGDCDILVYKESKDLLRVRLQSRHVSSKSYFVWIQYDSDHVKAWYCQCKAGARTVGTCSHVAAVIWYLGTSRQQSDRYGVQDWTQYLDDAAEMPQPIDSSDSEDSIVEE